MMTFINQRVQASNGWKGYLIWQNNHAALGVLIDSPALQP
jgi:hypothetical protein